MNSDQKILAKLLVDLYRKLDGLLTLVSQEEMLSQYRLRIIGFQSEITRMILQLGMDQKKFSLPLKTQKSSLIPMAEELGYFDIASLGKRLLHTLIPILSSCRDSEYPTLRSAFWHAS